MPDSDASTRNHHLLERFNEILTTRDYDAFDEVLSPDFVQEIPQSGERVRGIANFRATLECMPGPAIGIQVQSNPYISSEASHYVMTPTFNVVKVGGSADELTSYVKARYPDGSEWYIVSFTTFKDGKIVKRVGFFAKLFDPPAYRAKWVEPMEL